MSDRAYYCLARLLRYYIQIGYRSRQVYGLENLSEKGPGIIVANHLGQMGPLFLASALPPELRVYPWSHGSLGNIKKCVSYLWYWFGQEDRHPLLRSPLIRWFPSVTLPFVLVPLFNMVDAIPVHRRHGSNEGTSDAIETFRLSREALDKDRTLLIFPEDLHAEPDKETGLHPLREGIGFVPRVYLRNKADLKLPIYPVVVHPEGHVMFGEPIILTPKAYRKLGRGGLTTRLEETMRGIYRELRAQPGI